MLPKIEKHLLFGFRVHHDGHRAVIEQGNLHIGAENAAFGFQSVFRNFFFKIIKKRNSLFRFCRIDEGRTVAFFIIRNERKLAYAKDFTGNIHHRKIHFAILVAENSQVDDFLHQPVGIVLLIVFSNTDQQKKSALDFSGRFAVNLHARMRNPLYYSFHLVVNIKDIGGAVILVAVHFRGDAGYGRRLSGN